MSTAYDRRVAVQRLSWPPLPGAHEYRVLVRKDGDDFVFDRTLTSRGCSIPTSALVGSTHSWQVLWRGEGDSAWRRGIPELPLEPEGGTNLDPARNTRLRWEDRGAVAYRVLIRDHRDDGLLLKLPLLDTTYLVDWATLPAGRSYRWRVQAWDIGTGSWLDLQPYQPLPGPPGSQARPIQVREPTPHATPGPRMLVLFTVDTEATLQYAASPDPRQTVHDQIFAPGADGSAGIEMIMAALDRHGFKGTFFLDILSEYQFGEGAMEPVVQAIKARGHDIQLHLHTAPHLRFAASQQVRELADALPSYDPDQFRRAVELALDLFVARVGEEPVAFRSGAYRICDAYLDVLKEFGFRIDSSVYAFRNCQVSPWMQARTQPFRIGELLEVPVTWRLEWRSGGPVAMQFAPWQPGGDENRSFTGLTPSAPGPPVTLVYLAHSYQYLTRGPDIGREEQRRWHRELEARLLSPDHAGLYDHTDPPWFFEGPDSGRIGLLERNLADLAARGDVAALPMRSLASKLGDSWDERSLPVDPVPEVVVSAGQRQLTGTRVYSLDYLRHLGETAPRPADRRTAPR